MGDTFGFNFGAILSLGKVKGMLTKTMLLSLVIVCLCVHLSAAQVLLYAIKDKISPQMVSQLIKWRADVNARGSYGKTALIFAANRDITGENSVEICDILLRYGAEVNVRTDDSYNNGITPLLVATHTKNDIKVVKSLVDAGANVNVRDKKGWTPLMTAASNSLTQVVKFLLEEGADPEMTNFYRKNALYYAKKAGCHDCVKIIESFSLSTTSTSIDWLKMAKGTNANIQEISDWIDSYAFVIGTGIGIDTRDKFGSTALHKAANKYWTGTKSKEICRLLLDKNPDVNACDKSDNTPLMIAALHNNAEVVKLLLERGANPEMRNETGQTALDISEKYKCPESARIIGENMQLQCCICYMEFMKEDDKRKTPCKHIYHADCINSWLRKSTSCPVCRGLLSKDKLMKNL